MESETNKAPPASLEVLTERVNALQATVARLEARVWQIALASAAAGAVMGEAVRPAVAAASGAWGG